VSELFNWISPGFRADVRREFVLRKALEAGLRYVSSDWLHKNWAIWEAFEGEADARYGEGHRKWGARTIGEYIRRETRLRERAGSFKVNDHIWPDLSRLWLALHPDREDFFELRGRES
jgi:hypothetical protein